MAQIAVLGAGSWGTTLAARLGERNDVVLWGRDAALVEHMATRRHNHHYVADLVLPERVRVTTAFDVATANAEFVIMSVPSRGFRDVLKEAAPTISPAAVVVSVAKGLERDTRLRMSEVATDLIPNNATAVLTGPNLASEIARSMPAASVAASLTKDVAVRVQSLFDDKSWRVFRSADVVGCELAGVTKNVIAIAVGMVEGLVLGHNASAGLIARGLREMTKLGVAAGGEAATFAGLAGLGDLVVTCTSKESRNFTAGYRLGRGQELDANSPMIAEGVESAESMVQLGAQFGLEMPIASAVSEVVRGDLTPEQAVERLMARPAGEEF